MAQNVRDIDDNAIPHNSLAVGENILYQLQAALRALFDRTENGEARFIPQFSPKQPDGQCHGRENILQVVRDSPRQQSDAFHLLRLDKLRLEPLAYCNVCIHDEKRFVSVVCMLYNTPTALNQNLFSIPLKMPVFSAPLLIFQGVFQDQPIIFLPVVGIQKSPK